MEIYRSYECLELTTETEQLCKDLAGSLSSRARLHPEIAGLAGAPRQAASGDSGEK